MDRRSIARAARLVQGGITTVVASVGGLLATATATALAMPGAGAVSHRLTAATTNPWG